MTGPVQVLVVGFAEPTYSGEVIAEIRRLEQAGIVRLVDLLVVSHAEDGTLETVDVPGLSVGTGRIAAGLLGAPAVPDSEDAHAEGVGTWSLGDAVPVGEVAAVALIEHVWAIPLRTAMSDRGARPLDETWLGPEDLERLEELIADAPV